MALPRLAAATGIGRSAGCVTTSSLAGRASSAIRGGNTPARMCLSLVQQRGASVRIARRGDSGCCGHLSGFSPPFTRGALAQSRQSLQGARPSPRRVMSASGLSSRGHRRLPADGRLAALKPQKTGLLIFRSGRNSSLACAN